MRSGELVYVQQDQHAYRLRVPVHRRCGLRPDVQSRQTTWGLLSRRRDSIPSMALFLPIKTTILSAFSRKDEPPGVCPDCQDEEDPREAVVDVVRKRGHTEEEARDIEQEMFDAAREMFGTPPPEGEEPEPPKDN